jgi:hypothetical protein
MAIITKHKDTTGAAAAALDTGELGVNTVDGTLSVGTSGGNVELVGGFPEGAGTDSLRIGTSAGATTQGDDAVAIGSAAGETSQGADSVGVGYRAGRTSQGTAAVAVGTSAGSATQGVSAVAVGQLSGNSMQSTYGVAVGASAGQTSQGTNTVAVGRQAGKDTQGDNSVAVGRRAGETSQGANGIIINSSGAALDDTTAGHIHIASDDGSLDFLTASGWSMSDDLGVTGAVTATGLIAGSRVRSSANGSTASPSFTWSTDTDTGMYRVSGGVIGFSSNATEVMTVGATVETGNGELVGATEIASPTEAIVNSITTVTQAQYDAIGTPDANTLYIII